MARSLGETTITVSVLDRLIDLEPDNRMENPLSRSQSVRLLKSAVRRDLEWLLNSRRICDPPDEGLKEVNRSTYTYGLPDLSTLTTQPKKTCVCAWKRCFGWILSPNPSASTQ
jgi:type VI secretion system protein ImpF